MCVLPAALAPRGGFRRGQVTHRRRLTNTQSGGNKSVNVIGVTEMNTKEISADEESQSSKDKGSNENSPVIDRGLGLRRALSDETQSRPFLPLGGEVLHVAWLRSADAESSGKVTRSEAESDRACLEQLLEHYAVDPEEVTEVLERVARGWNDVTLSLGNGYYCRLQRYSEFDTLTLSGPGEPDAPTDLPVPHWNEMLPKGWLSTVPGRVFLCAHVVVRDVDPLPNEQLDDARLWNELQRVTNAIGWERRVEDGGAGSETQIGSAQMEAIEAIAEEIEIGCAEYDEDGECLVSFSSEDSMDMDDTESNSEVWENLSGELNGSASSLNGAALTGRRVILRTNQSEPGVVDEDCVASISDEECASDTSGHGASTEPNSSSKIVIRDPNFDKKEREKKERRKKEKKRKKLADKDRLNSREYTSEYTPARWQSWGTQVESNRIVAADFRRGARFYGNYHLDEEGGMTCMLLSPRGASVIQAARQLQRYFTIEQYRLLVLARLPGANSRYPTLAKLNSKYESVAQSIRRMNKSTTLKGNWFQRTWKALAKENVRTYKTQQDFLETITDLEQATAQELARAKSEAATAMAYDEIIETRLEEAEWLPLGGEVRFIPPYVRKRLDPAISTINSVAERAQILSDALERTTGLLQAGVEVRLQRLNERIARYGLVFTFASVFFTAASAICYEGPLKRAFEASVKWIIAHPITDWLGPILLGP